MSSLSPSSVFPKTIHIRVPPPPPVQPPCVCPPLWPLSPCRRISQADLRIAVMTLKIPRVILSDDCVQPPAIISFGFNPSWGSRDYSPSFPPSCSLHVTSFLKGTVSRECVLF
jgi:hypothetical protein